MRLRLALSASLAALLAVAGCTSSSGDSPSSPPPDPNTSAATPTSPTTPTTAVPSAPTSTSAAPTPSRFARLRGAVLLIGPTASTSDVYEVTATGLTRRTAGARITAVTADPTRIVVDAHNHLFDLVGSLHTLGAGPAFAPALSQQGVLASVALQAGSSTPGVTKPKGFELRIQSTPKASPRAVYSTTSSLGNPLWTGRRTVLIAASDGAHTTLLTIDTTTGATHDVASLGGAALTLSAGTDYLTAGQQGQFSLVPVTGGTAHSGPAGWTPLCWTAGSILIAARGRALATIAVGPAGAATPRVFAQVPAGLNTYSADCSRVGS